MVKSVGKLFSPPDIDAMRQYFARKSRAMTDKLMSVGEAVERLIHDGDYLATAASAACGLPPRSSTRSSASEG
jgi:hypothetical protein